MFNNRETRDSLTAYESNFLNQTFTYLGAGLGIVAASSYGLHRTNFSYRIMRANPWLVIGVSLVASVGSMMAVFSTPPENTGQKMFWWTAFNIAQSATLAPLFFFSPALLARAGLYTAGLVGSLCYVGATARSDKYLYIGGKQTTVVCRNCARSYYMLHIAGPLFAGLCVVALSSLAPLILPVGTAALAATQGISLYGGLAVFGGFVLYDTQKVLEHSRLAEQGVIPADPVAES